MDTSRRNNLLYFRDLKVGTLDLIGHDAKYMEALLSGETVSLARLLPEGEAINANARMREISKRALANMEERGLQTLFLAHGMATWPAADEGRPPEAAILLIPLVVEGQSLPGRALSLKCAGDPQVNLNLLHALETEHGCKVEAETLLPSEEEEVSFEPQFVFDRLRQAAQQVKGFQIAPRAVIGNFSFQKMAMVKDLQERDKEMIAYDVIAALSGDLAAREKVRSARVNVEAKEIDLTPPDNEFLVMDADSSQQCVIAAVLKGQDGVIQGPPGTGKSQTIANLIASLAAEGKRVLFVAEKRAALEVVLQRLEKVGLGHLALDLHGADISQRALIQRLGETLAQVREATRVASRETHLRFTDRRLRLNEHAARMHQPRSPSGLSLYELQGRLLCLPPEAFIRVRWRGPELNRLDNDNITVLRDLLHEGTGFASLLYRNDPSLWTGANLKSGEAAQHATDLVNRLGYQHGPALQQSFAELIADTGLRSPQTGTEMHTTLLLLEEVTQTLATYHEDLFRQDLGTLVADLAPAEHGSVAIAWAMLSNSAFRRAKKTLLTLRRNGPTSIATLYDEVRRARDQRQHWRALATPEAVPVAPAKLDVVQRDFNLFTTDRNALSPFFPGIDLEGMSLQRLMEWMNGMATDSVTPFRIPRLLEIEQEIETRGAKALLAEIRLREAETRDWMLLLDYAWYASCIDQVRVSEPILAGFDGRTHNNFVEEFRQSDRERLALASARVKRAHGERVIAALNAYKDQADLVHREVNKRTRHLPLRKLLAQAPDVLTAICPCWMASPLSVSQLLAADRRYFDVVLFDEASQVLPEDAVPALLRATHVVVAGDEHQLPPTTFFADGGADGDDGDGASAIEGFESLLGMMNAFLNAWPLEWHYRSKDEALIAFSNRHIYGNRLITFPGCGGSLSCLTHELVTQDSGQDGQEESASTEVRRVVELVLEHAEKRPNETLGVIAMGIIHARRVEAALEEALKDRPELLPYFDTRRHERFFVKNLERVQGDERDAILLTIGYGKDRSGHLPYRFGPLLGEGGYRRLNVAITRARRRMTVVSSFSHLDMDPNRLPNPNVRHYLRFRAIRTSRTILCRN